MNKLSVITVNFNNNNGLKRTINSVFSQIFTDYEYIIIDGGSTDGSKALIEQNSHNITYWVSEPDRGIYHAMNKGIAAAKGEYLLFLNSGDWLADDTIIERAFSHNPKADIVSGDVYFYDTEKNAIKWHVPSPENLTAKALFLGTLPHQATFIKRDLFRKFGPYDETLQIAADWLFFVKVLLEHQCTYEHIPLTISYFAMDGISCSPSSHSLPRKEQLQELQNKYPRFVPDYELLGNLEKEMHHWKESREYTVYQWMKRWGLIQAGILVLRAIRSVKRKTGFLNS